MKFHQILSDSYIFFITIHCVPTQMLAYLEKKSGRPRKQEGPTYRGSLEVRAEMAVSDRLSLPHLNVGSCPQ